jgi:serine/threonine protein kinase
MQFKDPWIGKKVGPENREYQIVRRIGRGGMGHVFLAEDTWIQQKVAIKLMSDSFVHMEDFHHRFKREFDLCINTESDHIVQVRDYGVTGEGYPFYVMEFLKGQTLGDLMQEKGQINLADSLELTKQICKGLEVLHKRAIHRDLKPENIFIVETSIGPLAKILDLGIAKKIITSQTQVTNPTQTAMFLGNKHFTSPEQLRSAKNVDARSDIYCLGMILYEMLSGQNPFGLGNNEIDGAWDMAHKATPPIPLTSQAGCEKLPLELQQIVSTCLEKEAEQRYRSALEMRQSLEAIRPAPPNPNPDSTVVSAPSLKSPTIPPLSATFKKKSNILLQGSGKVISLCFSPDRQTLASLYLSQFPNQANPSPNQQPNPNQQQFTIRVWDLKTRKSLEDKSYHASILAVGFNATNDLLAISAARDGRVIVFDVKTKNIYYQIQHRNKVNVASLDPYQNFVLVSDQGDIQHYNLGASRHPQEYTWVPENSSEQIHCAAPMPNGKCLLMVTAKNTIYQMIWKNRILTCVEGKSGNQWLNNLQTLAQDNSAIGAIAVHPDNQTVAVGSENKKIKLWNFNEQRGICNLSSQISGLCTLAFSADGQLLASGHGNGVIQIWQQTL